jgi:hypothetical protein
VRRWILYSIAVGVLLSLAPPAVRASTAGRRNTAVAATAVAVGAWSNGTGRKGRRNTALLATAGAAYAWKRHNDKKKEVRRAETVRVVHVSRPTRVVRVARPARVVHTAPPTKVVRVASNPSPHKPACPSGHACGIKEYEHKADGETKIKYLCGAEYERKASGETKFKR